MLKKAAIKQLESLRFILNQIKDEDYNRSINILKNSSVSKHVRHILEFYSCLLLSEDASNINYDKRKRSLLLEENIKYTLDYITEIIDTIEKIDSNKRLLLTSSFENTDVSFESSLYRELAYNIEHTVHHLAIIGIAIPLHFNYISLDENFGYSSSTLQFLETKKVA